jgi:Highly conserved protein containing a thioredoxin domain
MLHRITLTLTLIFCASIIWAQTPIYDDKADAMNQIQTATEQAQREGKHVLCQVGGNWCPWCLRFAAFAEADSAVHATLEKDFVYIHVNWSKENKNPEAMQYLGNPARFGFPVFVILDNEGKPIHIQNSAYLEEGKGYSEAKVVEFLKAWTPEAVKTLR